MPVYAIRVTTKKGPRDIEVDASNENEARAIARKQGKVLTLKRKRMPRLGGGLTPADRLVFLQRLSAMLASKVGTGEALALLRDTFTGQIRNVSGNLLRRVEAGADIAGAMEGIGAPDFPETTVALIKAGSRGGETWRALRDATVFEREMSSIRQGANRGMWSAGLLFVVAVVLTLTATEYMGPKLLESPIMVMYKDAIDIDWVFTMASIMKFIMIFFVIIVGTLTFLGTIGRRLVPNGGADKIIMKIPYYKDLILARNNYTTLYGLGLLIGSGVRIEEALRLTWEAAPAGALKSDLRKALEAVRAGKPWAMSMDTLHPTDKAALATSQDREQTAKALDALAGQYRELYGARVASFTPAMQAVGALLLMGAGALIFGMTILPMLQVAKGVV